MSLKLNKLMRALRSAGISKRQFSLLKPMHVAPEPESSRGVEVRIDGKRTTDFTVVADQIFLGESHKNRHYSTMSVSYPYNP